MFTRQVRVAEKLARIYIWNKGNNSQMHYREKKRKKDKGVLSKQLNWNSDMSYRAHAKQTR